MERRQAERRHILVQGDDPLLTPEQKARYREAADLLRGWMQAEDDYDREVWPLIEQELKDQQRLQVAD